MQIRFIAGAIVTGVFFLVIFIVATVYFMRSKHQDELDKKSTNHLPLPMEYASNEGNYHNTCKRSQPIYFLFKDR